LAGQFIVYAKREVSTGVEDSAGLATDSTGTVVAPGGTISDTIYQTGQDILLGKKILSDGVYYILVQDPNYYERRVRMVVKASDGSPAQGDIYLTPKTETVSSVSLIVDDIYNQYSASDLYYVITRTISGTEYVIDSYFFDSSKKATLMLIQGVSYNAYLYYKDTLLAQTTIYPSGDTYSYTFVLDKAPNLKVTSLSVPTSVNYPEQVNITFTVSNTGDFQTVSSTEAVVKVNGIQVSSQTVPVLNSGESVQLTATWTPSEIGSYTLTVEVDPLDKVTEKDENDNMVSTTVTVYAAELSVSQVSFSSPIQYGAQNTATVMVSNSGNKAASNVKISLEVDGQELGSTTTTVSAGSISTVEVSWIPNFVGSKTVTVVVDPNDTIVETDETNNQYSTTITAKYAELTITQVTFSSPIQYGVQNTATVTIKNSGTIEASNVKVSLKIDGKELGSATATVLAGGVTDLQVAWTPNVIGSEEVVVIVDPANTTPEMNESNNTFKINVTIQYKDLEIVSVTPPSEEILLNNTYKFTVQVRNSGDLPCDATTIVLKENGVTKDTQMISILNPGDTVTVSLTWKPTVLGGQLIEIVVDPLNSIPEYNESNNEHSYFFNVLAPDFVVEQASIEGEPVAGALLNVSVIVSNIGNVGAESDVTLLEGEDTLATTTVMLNESETKTVNFSVVLSTFGSTTLQVCADNMNLYHEMDENNNCHILVLQVKAPDLTVEVLSPEEVEYTTDGVPIKIKVSNIGNYDAGSFKVMVSVPGYDPILLGVANLSANSYTTLTANLSLGIGVKTFTVTVDPTNTVIEANENNNVVSQTVVVSGADLYVDSVSIPDTILLNDTIDTTVEVKNAGTITVDSFNVTMKVDGVEIKTITTSQSIVVFSYNATETGTHIVEFSVTPIGKVDINPDNNKFTTEIKVTAPDLYLSVVAPDIVDALSSFTVSISVKNQGNAPANGFSLIATYGDQTQVKQGLSCDPGKTLTYTFTFTGLKNEGYLYVKVDPDNVIAETDEYNNEFNHSIAVRVPDLRVSINAPSSAPLNQKQTIQVTVVNAGEVKGTGTVKVSIDNTTILSKSVTVDPMKTTTLNAYYTPAKDKYSSYGSTFTVTAEVESEFGTYSTSTTLRVVAPDLAIDYISVPSEVSLGEETYITVRVINKGDYKADSFTLKLQGSAGTLGTVTIENLSPGSSTARTFKWTPQQLGTFTFEAIVDPENKIVEWDESNNKQTQTVVRAPDLVIESVTVNETEFYVFTPYDVHVKVANIGSVAADNVVVEMVYENSTKSVTVSRIDPGNSTVVTLLFAPTTNGTIAVNFTVDPSDTVMETNEDNNQYVTEFFVKMPDNEVNITNADLPPELKDRATTTLSWSMFAGYIMSAAAIIYGAAQFVTTGGEIGRKYVLLGILGALVLTFLNPGIAALKP
jgi:subtilase family serine protease